MQYDGLAPTIATRQLPRSGFVQWILCRRRHKIHKTANVLNKVALSVQVNMKTDLREIYGAPTRPAAEAALSYLAPYLSANTSMPDKGPGGSARLLRRAVSVPLHPVKDTIPLPNPFAARPDRSAGVGDRWQVRTAHFRKQR
jgi:hypothetical protein